MADQVIGLRPYLIAGVPSSMYYLPNFISSAEEDSMLSAIHDIPSVKWTNLAHRRLLSLPSQLTGIKKDTLIQDTLPKYLLHPVVGRLREWQVFQHSLHQDPNHCLVNEYHPGQGILPHEDGPAYYPITATVSLGSHTVLDIYRKNEDGERDTVPTWRILQEPRSLLVTVQEAYTDTLHGIQAIDRDESLGQGGIANWDLLKDHSKYLDGQATRTTRISLTYRDVLKVSKLGGALKFITKK